MGLEVDYSHDLYHNYLIVSEESNPINSNDQYQMDMVMNNNINYLLNLNVSCINGKSKYFYDITSKQIINDIFEKRKLSYKELKSILWNLLEIFHEGKKYLLNSNHFIIDPHYIYYDLKGKNIAVAFYIGYERNIMQQLSELIEYFMNKVDHTDERAVIFIYSLYQASREENASLVQLEEIVQGLDSSKTSDDEKDDTPIPYSDAENSVKEVVNIKKDEVPVRNRIVSSVTQRPIMEERFEDEQIRMVYPNYSYVKAGLSCVGILICIMLLWKQGLLSDSITNEIVFPKLLAVLIIAVALDAYFLSKVFHKEAKVEKVITGVKYIPDNLLQSYQLDTKVDQTGGGNYSKVGDRYSVNDYSKVGDRYSVNDYSKGGEKCPASDYSMVNDRYPVNTYSKKKDSYPANETKRVGIGRGELEKEYGIEEERIAEDDFMIEEKTQLLSFLQPDCRYRLKAKDNLRYQDIPLIEFPFFIGKLKMQVDYALDNTLVSRYHAKISRESEEFYITDLNSTNGTFLNNVRIDPQKIVTIQRGDIIAFADATFTFEEVES